MTEMDVWSCCSEVEDEDLQRGSPARRLSRGQSSERIANRAEMGWGCRGLLGAVDDQSFNPFTPTQTLISTLLSRLSAAELESKISLISDPFFKWAERKKL